jgi:hypothetical protein
MGSHGPTCRVLPVLKRRPVHGGEKEARNLCLLWGPPSTHGQVGSRDSSRRRRSHSTPTPHHPQHFSRPRWRALSHRRRRDPFPHRHHPTLLPFLFLLLLLPLLSAADHILEDGYTVTTAADLNRLPPVSAGPALHPYALLPRPRAGDLVVLDSAGSALYTLALGGGGAEPRRLAAGGGGTGGRIQRRRARGRHVRPTAQRRRRRRG